MFHYDAGLFLTLAQLGGRRSPPPAAVLCVARAYATTSRGTNWRWRRAGTACLYRHRLGPQHRVLEMAVPRAARVRRPAADRLSGRPLPGLGHAAGRMTATQIAALHGRLQAGCSPRRPSRPSCRTRTFSSWNRRLAGPTIGLPPRAEVIDRLLELVHSRSGRGKDARDSRLSAWQVAGSHEAAHAERRARAAASGRVRKSAASTKNAASTWATSACSTASRSMAMRSSRCRDGSANFACRGLGKTVSIAVTGWAADASDEVSPGRRSRAAAVRPCRLRPADRNGPRVEPREIFCTHGPAEFADHLCDLGFNAYPLQPAPAAAVLARLQWQWIAFCHPDWPTFVVLPTRT